MVETRGRMRERTRALLVNFERAVGLLDASIEAELVKSSTRDPRHHLFSMAARALIARRANLEATISALSDELAREGRVA